MCANIPTGFFLSIAPFKGTKMNKNEQKSLRNRFFLCVCMCFYTGRKKFYREDCLFYAKLFEFEVKS